MDIITRILEVILLMDAKPLHYDGSMHNASANDSETIVNKSVNLTDEMRKNISGNPYVMESSNE